MFRNIAYLVLIFLLCSQLNAQNTVYKGLLVGIEDYPGENNDLNWCVEDVEDMQNALIDHQGWSLSDFVIKLNNQATGNNIVAALNYIRNHRTSGETDLFHYSGHGNTAGLDTYDMTLIPNDLEYDLGYNGFNSYTAILDACHAGVFANAMSTGVILAGCLANQYSYEINYLENGAFTYHVVDGIKNNNAADANGNLSAEGLHTYAFYRTIGSSSGQQVPQLKDNYSGKLVLNSNALSKKAAQQNKVKDLEENNKPSEYLLFANYPNPFNPNTTISYQLPEQGFVTLKVYDMLGKEMAVLVNEINDAGKYNVSFDASNLSSGIYVYQIGVQSFKGSQNFFTQTNKMLLVK